MLCVAKKPFENPCIFPRSSFPEIRLTEMSFLIQCKSTSRSVANADVSINRLRNSKGFETQIGFAGLAARTGRFNFVGNIAML